MAQRIDEALELVRRNEGTPHRAAAIAYLRAQVEQAAKVSDAPRLGEPSSLAPSARGAR